MTPMWFQPFLHDRVLAEHAAEELLHHPHPTPKKTRPWVYWALGLGAPWQTKVCLLFVEVVRAVYPTLRNQPLHRHVLKWLDAFSYTSCGKRYLRGMEQIQGFSISSDDYP